MFWLKKETTEAPKTGIVDAVATEAEGLFRSGKMHCAEAVLSAIRNHFRPDSSEEILHLVAGFGGGSGTGCICGAVAGGTMAIGLVRRDRKRTAQLTKELQLWFKSEYGATCCKLITTNGKKGCPLLTGRVAGRVAELLSQEN